MRKIIKFLVMILPLLATAGCRNKTSELSIPYESYKLDNGLTVILNEDKSDPITSFVVLYHVGSNRETMGKTGFAHLFEHMMFQRSENVGEDQFFKYVEGAGGELNGGTGNDFTIYFEVVPNNALELCMWLESDRMGYLLNTVTPSSFANQQNVVQNEKRQSYDNRPYGYTDFVIEKNLYPEGHPYSWQVIGDMSDLENATIEDVKAFHDRFYVPNNATIVVSGDYQADTVKQLIEKYFGEIPAGEKVDDPEPLRVTLKETKKLFHEDNFARASQYTMVFPVAEQFTHDAYALNILSNILGEGKKSPLYKVLVKERKLTSAVDVYNDSRELSGEFRISVTANPGISLEEVEKSIFEAFNRFEEEGFTERDLERSKAKLETMFYNMMSSVMYKSFLLAQYSEYAGTPSFATEELKQIKQVTSQDVLDVYNRYIKDHNYVATSFVPKGQTDMVAEGSVNAGIIEEDIKNATKVDDINADDESIEKSASSFDRSVPPVPGPDPTLTIPEVWRGEASNGIKIYGIEHHELPLIQYSLVIKGGHMLDDINKPGVAKLMAQMLNEGTRNKTPEELEEEIDLLGATIRVSGGDENITVYVSTLARNFEQTTSLVREMLLEPRWDDEQFEIVKARTVNSLRRSLANPNYLANSTLNRLMYGPENIFSIDANGTIESVESITIDDLKSFYEINISPSVTNLLVVGDIEKKRVEDAFADLFSQWMPHDVNMPVLVYPPVPDKPSVHFVDVPGAKQSVIAIGTLAMPRNHPDFYSADVANFKLGGGSNGRLFMVLREEKGFTYGAYSGFYGQKDHGYFKASSSVRSDATYESVMIFRDLMTEYREGVPQEYVDFTKGSLLRANALRFETLYALLGMLSTMTSYDLPSDYIKQEEQYLRGLTAEQMGETVNKYIDPMKMYYVIVGDAETQMKGLSKLGLGKPVLE